MPKIRIPSTEELNLIKEYIGYNSKTGKLIWIKTSGDRVPKGSEIKRPCGQGYYRVSLKNKDYKASRVAWFLHYGEWPKLFIDHINGIKNDNRIENLKIATVNQNMQNLPSHRKGIPIGVYWNKQMKKWRARTPEKYLNWNNKNRKHLGYYNTKEEAGQAVVDFCSKEF